MSGGRNELKELIVNRIRREGPISFRDFMEMALYHPCLGYYEKNVKIGKEGDFITSPKVGGIFGRALFNALREMLELSDSDILIEIGAGDGTLSLQILDSASSKGFNLNYIIVEKSKKNRDILREKLKDHRVKIYSDIEEIEKPQDCVIFSNELLDALPVHIVEFDGNEFFEIFVTEENGTLKEIKLPLTNRDIINYLSNIDFELEKGQRIEINLEARKILKSIDNVLKRGFVVFIDYGHVEKEILAPYRIRGTIRGFKKHRLVEDILENPGDIDITSSVNFSAIYRFANEIGFKLVGFTNQANFLLDSGILEEIVDEKDIFAVKYLTLPESGGMGEIFKVMILSKNIETTHLKCLTNSPQRESYKLP